MNMTKQAKFGVGQLVHHRLFDYRGVIVDVDPEFRLSDEWYQQMTQSRPPKDQPWYRILVEDTEHQTYVAEKNLEEDDTGEPVTHNQLGSYFSEFKDGRYQWRFLMN
jgi:heat shock protein HspQ